MSSINPDWRLCLHRRFTLLLSSEWKLRLPLTDQPGVTPCLSSLSTNRMKKRKRKKKNKDYYQSYMCGGFPLSIVTECHSKSSELSEVNCFCWKKTFLPCSLVAIPSWTGSLRADSVWDLQEAESNKIKAWTTFCRADRDKKILNQNILISSNRLLTVTSLSSSLHPVKGQSELTQHSLKVIMTKSDSGKSPLSQTHVNFLFIRFCDKTPRKPKSLSVQSKSLYNEDDPLNVERTFSTHSYVKYNNMVSGIAVGTGWVFTGLLLGWRVKFLSYVM